MPWVLARMAATTSPLKSMLMTRLKPPRTWRSWLRVELPAVYRKTKSIILQTNHNNFWLNIPGKRGRDQLIIVMKIKMIHVMIIKFRFDALKSILSRGQKCTFFCRDFYLFVFNFFLLLFNLEKSPKLACIGAGSWFFLLHLLVLVNDSVSNTSIIFISYETGLFGWICRVAPTKQGLNQRKY